MTWTLRGAGFGRLRGHRRHPSEGHGHRSPDRLRRSQLGGALTALAAGSVVAVVLGAAPAAVAAALGAVVTVVGIVAALPQLLGVLLDRTTDLSGMSPARWSPSAGSCATWTTYGWVLGQPAVRLSAGFGLVCAVATSVALHHRRTVPPVLSVTGRRPAVAARPALAAAA